MSPVPGLAAFFAGWPYWKAASAALLRAITSSPRISTPASISMSSSNATSCGLKSIASFPPD
eukprot:1433736-Pyramimonas_sp.AAC.1